MKGNAGKIDFACNAEESLESFPPSCPGIEHWYDAYFNSLDVTQSYWWFSYQSRGCGTMTHVNDADGNINTGNIVCE